MKKIIYTNTIEKNIAHLDTNIRNIAIKKIELLAKDDEFLDIKKLEPKKE